MQERVFQKRESDPQASKASSWLTVDLEALAANYRLLKEKVGPNCTVAGVVKADGYGTGAAQAFQALFKENCGVFFVATLDEALELRHINRDVMVAVLGGLYQGAEKDYLTGEIVPVLNSLEEIKRWQNFVRQRDSALPAILHFDTGMNRLGLGPDEAEILLEEKEERLKGLDVQIIMSHFACADEVGHPTIQNQFEKFQTLAVAFPDVQKSLANSSGVFRSPDYHFDMVRPGVALYGGNPVPETENPMKTVIHLDVRVLQVRNVKAGETIGYGATHKFKKDTQTATVALGYADGFFRSASGKAQLYWNGQPCPVLGRVSMDLVSVGIGDLPDPRPQPGDTLEVLGPHQSVDDLAQDAGTISYEILTALGRRYHRTYIG